MNSNYRRNKELAKYRNTDPTMTDQAGATDTDINVIVRNFNVHGQAPGTSREPTYADFSALPNDFRDMIEAAREAVNHYRALPAELRDIPLDELVHLSNDDIARRIRKPDEPAKPQTPAEPVKETKE